MNTVHKNQNLFRLVFPMLIFIMLVASACGTLQIETEPLIATAEPVAVESKPPEQLTTVVETVEPSPEPAATPTETVSADMVSSEAADEASDEAVSEMAKPAEISTLDDTWLQYTNYGLGFSINFPRTMVHPYGSCKWNEENGDHSYRPDPAFVPVAIFEDGNTVYLTNAYYHELSGETKESDAGGGTRTFFSDCQAVDNSLELLADPENGYQTNVWAIVIEEAGDDRELEAFIKGRYGEGCRLGEKTAAQQEGVFDVSVLGDGKDLEQTLCPLNYGTVIKHYPEANKVIAWDTGQAPTFVADTNYAATYDQEMIDSFRFLTGATVEAASEPAAEPTAYDYDGWLAYTNDTLGYSLMHPAETDIMGENKDASVEFVGPLVDNEHWPWFTVSHYDSEFFHPPAGADVGQWIADSNIPVESLAEDVTIGGLPAVHFSIEASPQAYGRDEYYLIHGDQLIQITILHADGLQDWTLYDQFLQSIAFDPL